MKGTECKQKEAKEGKIIILGLQHLSLQAIGTSIARKHNPEPFGSVLSVMACMIFGDAQSSKYNAPFRDRIKTVRQPRLCTLCL